MIMFAWTAGPSAAQDKAAPAPADPAARIAQGRDLFANYGCGGCHSLADACAMGRVGPPLDGDANLTEALVGDRVTNGSGPMPSFGGQMSGEEIAAVAAYVVHRAAK
jgi:mono/diheme cytochrome c family protein